MSKKTFSNVKLSVEFSDASKYENIVSGENISTILGKQRKWFDYISETSKKYETLQEQIGFDRKNLLKNTSSVQVESGMRFFTNKGDGSVTANGTATDDTMYKIGDIAVSEKKRYILSGCPAGGSSSTYYLCCKNSADDDIQGTYDYGNGVEFEISESFSVWIVAKSGTTIENMIFYPMVRNSLIADDTYEMYITPVGTQLESIGDLPAVNSCTLGYMRKNILKVTASTITKDGVTMTVNSDGTLSLSGTATARSILPITSMSNRNPISDLPTDFILSGEDQMMGVECCIGVEISTGANSGYVASFYDGDNGRPVSLSAYPTAKYWYAYMRIYEGVNVDGITIYPMIRPSDIKNADFEPYQPSVIQQINNIDEWMNELDSRVKIDSSLTKHTIGYTRKNALKVTASTTTVNGVTATFNADGSVTLSGTATERAVIPITNSKSRNKVSDLPTNFILSGGDQMLGTNLCIGVEVSTGASSGYVASFYDGDNGRLVNLSDYPTAKYWYAYIRIYQGINTDGITIYPMIRLSDISNSDFETYKPSVLDYIKELENRIAVLEGKNSVLSISDNSIDSNDFKVQNIDGENDCESLM